MNETATDPYNLIDSTEALEDLCTKIVKAGRVAVDTEFFWERTFYPELGIVQLGIDQNNAWLLDIPALNGKLEPLGRILANPEIEKILHDAKQDLTILRIATGYYPKNIFDTRLAAGFVGPLSSLSLLDACLKFTGEILSKDETRSNWRQRPLTEKQYQYALKDVIFLPAIRDQITSRAKNLGRHGWLSEEMKLYDDPKIYDDPAVNEVYSKVKGASRLSRSQLAILRELAAWREKEARKRNRPRRHIVPDPPLVMLATEQPTRIDVLQQNCSLSPRAVQRYGKQLLSEIQKGLQVAPSDYPLTRHRTINQKHSSQRRGVIDLITEACANNSLDPALIGKRKDIEKLIQSPNKNAGNNPLLKGWRYAFIGEKILNYLQQ